MDREANEAVLQELKDLGVKRAFVYTVDISNQEAVMKAAEKVRKRSYQVKQCERDAHITQF